MSTPVMLAYCRGRREREFAVADARGQAFGEFGGRFLAIGAYEFDQGREQAGLRHAIAIDAVEARFRPGFVDIAERERFWSWSAAVSAR